MVALEMYRQTVMGKGLIEVLDEMVSHGTLDPDLAMRVLLQFDESMSSVLEQQGTSRASFKGNLRTYNNCDDVWTFHLRGVTFKNEEFSLNIPRLKIVACNSSLTKPKE